jgi:hypothetical protein
MDPMPDINASVAGSVSGAGAQSTAPRGGENTSNLPLSPLQYNPEPFFSSQYDGHQALPQYQFQPWTQPMYPQMQTAQQNIRSPHIPPRYREGVGLRRSAMRPRRYLMADLAKQVARHIVSIVSPDYVEWL